MGFIEENNEKRRQESKQEAEKGEQKGIEKQPLAPISEPDPKDLESVITWYFKQIIFLLNKMSRKESGARLRALNSAMDSFAKLRRLSADTAELQQLKKELDELKREIQQEQQLRRVK